jgi:hypothetical protein
MLPDDVLLEIYHFYVDEDVDEDFEQKVVEWITLAHAGEVSYFSHHVASICDSFVHPKSLRGTLDIWPHLPLIIRDFNLEPSSVDNILAALEHNDRVCQIELLNLTSSELEYVTDSAAMRKPFPELTDLQLCLNVDYEQVDELEEGTEPILFDSFLGGTAPRLRSLFLDDVPFPGLLKLLLSATHLVDLSLYDIPRSGYIPPEVMATCLSALTNLRSLYLQFRYPPPRPAPEARRPPPPTRSILPSLTKIEFKGASEYLEEILVRIDAPRLHKLHITFFNQIIFDTPQLFQFISRRPTLRTPEKGHIAFHSEAIIVKFPSQSSVYDLLSLKIPCTASEWQVSSLEQVCTSSLPPVSTLEDLYIFENRINRPRWQDDVENTLWLDILRSFVAVRNLYLSSKFVPRIAPALHELVGGRTTEVLPALESIFLEDPWTTPHEGIEKFVAARRSTSHPVAVSRWDRKSQYHW